MNPAAVRAVTLLLALGSVAGLWGADSALGVATTNGDFLIDSAKVSGNATLFDGSLIETSKTPSRLQLTDGVRIALGAGSRARVRADRLELEAGMTEMASPGDYQIEAGSFRIIPATPSSAFRVARSGETAVHVAALSGSLRVYNATGLQLANVFPGTALSFEPQETGAAPPSSFLGCVVKKNDRFVLYDQATRILVELRGSPRFDEEWGNRVQVIGATDTSATSSVAAQVMDVTSMTRFGQGGCEAVANAIGGELPGGAASPAPPVTPQATTPPSPAPPPVPAGSGGMSAGAKVAIVAAIGGAGAAAAVLATQGGDNRSRD